MTLPTLSNCTDESLLTEVKNLRGTESKALADIVLHLSEIDTRGIYRDAGYSSLFVYCTRELGYSEASAHRRIEAARALKDSPEIYQLLREGKITLCAIGKVAKVLTPENKGEVLALSQGKPRVEVERIAARFGAVTPPKRETVRVRRVVVPDTAPLFSQAAEPEPKVEERFTVTMELTAEEMALYEEAKIFVGPCQVKDLFVKLTREFVRKRKPKTRTSNRVSKITSTLKVQSRYIPQGVKRIVRARDEDRCSYVSPEGKRCAEKHRLQFDHLVPFAFGGTNTPENLRLTCRAHNALYAERIFGREKIRSFGAERHRSP